MVAQRETRRDERTNDSYALEGHAPLHMAMANPTPVLVAVGARDCAACTNAMMSRINSGFTNKQMSKRNIMHNASA